MWLELCKTYKNYDVDQIILPRFSDGINNPAIKLQGEGVGTTITANANTLNQLTKYKSIIQSEDFGRNLAQWSAGEFNRPEYLKAFLRPELRDFTIRGYDETKSNYTAGGVVNNQPWQWNPSDKFPDLYGGIFLQSTGCRINNVNAFYIPGTAFWFTRTGAVNMGAIKEYDVEKNSIFDCTAQRCYRGFDIQTIDSMVGRLQGHALRDFGIKFSAGSTQIDGTIHFWGVFPGPCVWFPFSAGSCWGGPFYVENSTVGILVESSKNILGPIYSKDCVEANIKLFSERNTLGPLDIEVRDKAIGISIRGQFNKIFNSEITLSNNSSVGIEVNSSTGSGNRLVFDNINIIGNGGAGIKVNDVLNFSRISTHLQNLNDGIDLYPLKRSTLGVGNIIDVTYTNVSRPIILPPDWHISNKIYLNGNQITNRK